MQKIVRFSLLLACMAFLAGCQPVDSVNPLFTQKDVVFDPLLLGKWTDESATLEFFAGTNDGYYLVSFSDDSTPPEQMLLQGHLVNLQGHRFLDLAQKKWVGPPDLYQFRLEQTRNGTKVTPQLLHVGDGAYLDFTSGNADVKGAQMKLRMRVAHWFFKVSFEDKQLRLDYMDDDRLSKILEQKDVSITHLLAPVAEKGEITDTQQLVLTATTAELQQFVVEHVNDSQVFSDSIKMKRVEK